MPNIKSSTDLRNNYNEISKFCNEHEELSSSLRMVRGTWCHEHRSLPNVKRQA